MTKDDEELPWPWIRDDSWGPLSDFWAKCRFCAEKKYVIYCRKKDLVEGRHAPTGINLHAAHCDWEFYKALKDA